MGGREGPCAYPCGILCSRLRVSGRRPHYQPRRDTSARNAGNRARSRGKIAGGCIGLASRCRSRPTVSDAESRHRSGRCSPRGTCSGCKPKPRSSRWFLLLYAWVRALRSCVTTLRLGSPETLPDDRPESLHEIKLPMLGAVASVRLVSDLERLQRDVQVRNGTIGFHQNADKHGCPRLAECAPH